MMGLGRPAPESELGRKSTDLRARKRSRAHVKRTHRALQRTFGGRLRGEKPAERRARPDRRSGAHRSAQERRKAGPPAQDEPGECCSYGGKGDGKAAGREAVVSDTRDGPDDRSGDTTAAGNGAGRDPTCRSGSAGTRACYADRRTARRRSSRRRGSRASQAVAGAATGLGTDLPTAASAGGAAVRSKTAGASPGGNCSIGLARTANRPSRAARRGAATGRSYAWPRR